MASAQTTPAPPMPEPVLRRQPGTLYPQGPTLLSRLRAGDLFRVNPLPFITQNARTFGDLVHSRVLGRHVFQANHPDLVQELLITDARHHHRGIVMQKASFVLGQGLLTSEDPHHIRQRRLAQPAFHRDRIAGYGRIIGDYAQQTTATWQHGSVRDLHQDMQLLSLRIVGKTLFDSELESVNKRIAYAIDAFMGFLPIALLPGSQHMLRLPIPMMNRIRGSRRELDTLIYGMIAERRAEGVDRGDLLSMLLASQDTEGGTGGMTDEQVRSESVTALLAGNETTANGLSFALWLLAHHPEMQARLQAEASEVLGQGTAEAAHYSALPYAYACFAESMRLYPPVWTIARTAAEDYTWRGVPIARGSLLLAPQWVIHRDPRFWSEPDSFRPERFLPGAREGHPRFAYFPFAAGSRQCIGEGLAWMEGVLILATIARDWTLQPSGQLPAAIRPDAKITLRPKDGVPLRLLRR